MDRGQLNSSRPILTTTRGSEVRVFISRRSTTTATTVVEAGMLVSRVNAFLIVVLAHAFADKCRRRYYLPCRRLFQYDRTRTTVCLASVLDLGHGQTVAATSAGKLGVTACYIHPVSKADNASVYTGWLRRRQSASTRETDPGVRQRATGVHRTLSAHRSTNSTARIRKTID